MSSGFNVAVTKYDPAGRVVGKVNLIGTAFVVPGLMLTFFVAVTIIVSLASAVLSGEALSTIVTFCETVMLLSLITLTTALALPPGVRLPTGRATLVRRSTNGCWMFTLLVVTETLLLSFDSVSVLPVSASAIRKYEPLPRFAG